jgi:hypothetical protein
VHLTFKRVERAADASGTAQACAVGERSALIAGRKLVPMPPRPQWAYPPLLSRQPPGSGW